MGFVEALRQIARAPSSPSSGLTFPAPAAEAALACPLAFSERPIHVVNVSLTSETSMSTNVCVLEEPLLILAAQLRPSIGELAD